MKMKQVCERLGKHDNTIRNYARMYAEFLSPAPGKGEHRTFSDDDLRILGYICRLADSGMRHGDIHESLKRKFEEGTPFPPVVPPAEADLQALVPMAEVELQLAQKDALLKEMQGRLEELRRQVEQHKQERDSYMQQIIKLSEEIGKLRAQLEDSKRK